MLLRPIKMLELFGGLRTGLVAALKARWMIEKWIYVEANSAMRQMARHHVEILKAAYSGPILEGAVEGEW
ncbi:unnamed protein product [Closterium sp. NIES-54]